MSVKRNVTVLGPTSQYQRRPLLEDALLPDGEPVDRVDVRVAVRQALPDADGCIGESCGGRIDQAARIQDSA
jgi:hypothetical protein